MKVRKNDKQIQLLKKKKKIKIDAAFLHTHLDSLKDVPEDGPLLPLVRLGSVLVAVCGQRVQFVAKLIPVLELEILQNRQKSCIYDQRKGKKK